MRTAVIVGQNYPDTTLQRVVNEYHRVLIFEPLPDAAKECREACSEIPGVTVFQAACGENFSIMKLRVYNTNGLSSSLGEMSTDAVALYGASYDLSLKDEIDVQVVHLGCIMQLIGVSHIDLLLIDAQGYDFAILKTVEQWIADRRVRLIQLEAEGCGFRHYEGAPDNSEESIIKWMHRHPGYELSYIDGRLPQQPDLVFELKGGH